MTGETPDRRALLEAYARVSEALPTGWSIGAVQWGDDNSGPGPERAWYAIAVGPETDDPEDRDGRIGGGLTPVEALRDLWHALQRVPPDPQFA